MIMRPRLFDVEHKLHITMITRRFYVAGVDSQMKCKFCTNTESCMEYEEWEATTVT